MNKGFFRNLGAVCLSIALGAGYVSEYSPFKSVYGQERGSVARTGPNYAIIVSDATYRNKKWRRSVDALTRKYPGAHIIKFRQDIEDIREELREIQPTHVAYVAMPRELVIPEMPESESGQIRVIEASNAGRFNKVLDFDEDPYKDAIGSIITGFYAEDGERMASAKGFVVDNPLFKTQDECILDPLNEFLRGRSYSAGICPNLSEGEVRRRIKRDGITKDTVEIAGPEIVELLNSGEFDLFATEGFNNYQWLVGANYPDYVFEADGRGNIIVKDTENNVVGRVDSPNQKVYWGIGYSELARITGRNSIILAWIHSGGVDQAFSYLGEFRYGFASISIQNHLFGSDNPTFQEARHMNDIANRYLLDKLDEFSREHGLRVNSRDQRGRRYDEHSFVAFGDPALDVKVGRDPNVEPFLDKEMEITKVGGRNEYRFTVRSNRDGTLDWTPSGTPPIISPPVFLLPRRIGEARNIQVSEGLQFKIGDDFVVFDIGSKIIAEDGEPKLIPTQLREGQTWELRFTD